MNKATFLSKLNFVAEIDSKVEDKTAQVRTRFIEGIQTQIEAFTAQQAGKHFQLTRERREKDAEGNVVKTEKAVRFAVWWELANGNYFVVPRYGSKKIQLTEAGTAINAGKALEGVKNVLDMLIEATNAGELDAVLLKASERKQKDEAPKTEQEQPQAPEAAQQAETPKTGKTERNTRGH